MRIDLFREGQRLLAQSPPLFDGSVGVVTVRVNDRCGEDKVSALRFYTDESDIYSVDITDGEAQVPHEVIKTPGFTVAAAYYKADGENVERFLPTEGVFIPVMKNGYGAPDDAIEGENAAPSVLAQLLEKIAGYEAHRAAEVIDHPDGSVTAAKLAAKSIGREKLTDALAAELDKKADGADTAAALAAKADKATTLAGYGIGDAVGVSVSYEDKLDTLGEKGVYHIISQYSPDTGEGEGSDWTDYYVIVCPRGQSLFGSGTVPAQIRIKGALISTRYKYLTTRPGGESWSEWVTLANVSDMNTALAEKVDKEDGKGLSDAASVSVYHANAGNEVLQIVGQDGVTKLTPFYGKQAVDDQMSAFSLGLSEKVDKDTTGLRGLSNAKTVTLSDSISTPSQLKVTEQGGSEFVANFYGAELTDKMLAKLKEQSVPHTTASDYPVTLTDALAGESLRGLKVYGGRGKNLFDKDNAAYLIGYFSKTHTAITTHANARTIYIPCEPNTTYTISRNTSYTNFHFGYTTVLPAVGVAVNGYHGDATGSVTSFTLTTGADAKYLVSYIYNGYSEEGTSNAWDTIIGGIQIEEGSTATAWEEYKEVGDADGDVYKIPVRLRGKNLLSYPYIESTKTENGITFTVNGDGSIGAQGTATATAVFRVADVELIGGEKYTVSCPMTGNGASTYQFYLIDNGNTLGGPVYNITSGTVLEPVRTGSVRFAFIAYAGVNVNMVLCPQLEIGEAATAYEPYIVPQTQTATLTSPLTSGEYIDLLGKKRYASDGTATDITVTGELKTIESGIITIDCTTGVQPPRIEAEYWQDINKAIAGMKKGGTENEGQ